MMYLLASWDPIMFIHIPMEKRTRDICLHHVVRNGYMLANVPMELRDAKMCLAAVKSECRALYHIPFNSFTQTICDVIILDDVCLIKFLPPKFISQDNYNLAVREQVMEYDEVPDHMKTYQMSIDEVKKDAGIMKLVPERFKTVQFFQELSLQCIVID